MKQQLHRSITFWSGLLMMGFVCWAWRDSESRRTYSRYGGFGLHNCWGGLVLIDDPNSPSEGVWFERARDSPLYKHQSTALCFPLLLRGADVSIAEQEELDQRPLTIRGGDRTVYFTAHEFARTVVDTSRPSSWVLFIPHWLILLAVALPWTALLFWRARRRATAGATPEQQ